MGNSGRIVSKEALISRVWGSESDAEDNNVEAYISFLRKKTAFCRIKGRNQHPSQGRIPPGGKVMIKKLRRRFVLVNMAFVISILSAVLGMFYYTSFKRMERQTVMALYQAVDRNLPDRLPDKVEFGRRLQKICRLLSRLLW